MDQLVKQATKNFSDNTLIAYSRQNSSLEGSEQETFGGSPNPI